MSHGALMAGSDSADLHWSDWSGGSGNGWNQWDGSEGFKDNDKVVVLIDLDDGTLSVYQKKRRLGVMKDGLSGEYRWAETVWLLGIGVRIEARDLSAGL